MSARVVTQDVVSILESVDHLVPQFQRGAMRVGEHQPGRAFAAVDTDVEGGAVGSDLHAAHGILFPCLVGRCGCIRLIHAVCSIRVKHRLGSL